MPNLLPKAIEKAIALHDGQMRKGAKPVPYIVHPLRVGYILMQYTQNPNIVSAGILHDTIEDTEYTEQQLLEDFGEDITKWVLLVSHNLNAPTKEQRDREAIINCAKTTESMLIKTADAMANMQDIVSGIESEGSSFWDHFDGGKDYKISYYSAILDAGKDVVPEPMHNELKTLLEQIKGL